MFQTHMHRDLRFGPPAALAYVSLLYVLLFLILYLEVWLLQIYRAGALTDVETPAKMKYIPTSLVFPVPTVRQINSAWQESASCSRQLRKCWDMVLKARPVLCKLRVLRSYPQQKVCQKQGNKLMESDDANMYMSTELCSYST